MVITRTPLRISFFGGGTDYPVWYREHGGSVLATTINKCCYITCRQLPPFFEHHSRVSYSRVENVVKNGNIEVERILAAPHRLEELESHLALFFAGFSRTAAEIGIDQVKITPH